MKQEGVERRQTFLESMRMNELVEKMKILEGENRELQEENKELLKKLLEEKDKLLGNVSHPVLSAKKEK
jgi:protein subunit release factor B